MAEEKFEKAKKPEETVKKARPIEKHSEESLIRILATDIPGNKKIYVGLTRIKGVSWTLANAICKILKIPKNKAVKELTAADIDQISKFIKNPTLPEYLMNRRKDFETGETKHLSGADLDLQKEFDIKRIRKIKSYKGIRHSLGQPVRGQRTKSHFRKNKTVGVMKKPKTAK